jgi:hypothetical protein
VDYAIGIGVVDDVATMILGGAQAAEIEVAVDLLHLGREHAQGDLAGGGVVRGTKGAATLVGDLDGLAGLGAVAIDEVAGEDPRVAGGDAVGGFAIDTNFVH